MTGDAMKASNAHYRGDRKCIKNNNYKEKKIHLTLKLQYTIVKFRCLFILFFIRLFDCDFSL